MINNTDLCSGNHTTERGASGWAEALFTVTALMCGNAQAFKTSAWVMADKLR
jgi:hypothetical protein